MTVDSLNKAESWGVKSPFYYYWLIVAPKRKIKIQKFGISYKQYDVANILIVMYVPLLRLGVKQHNVFQIPSESNGYKMLITTLNWKITYVCENGYG